MKITGRQLRVIAKRESECFDRLCVLARSAGEIPLTHGRLKFVINEIGDALAELELYRELIHQNTKHTSELAFETVTELASHE